MSEIENRFSDIVCNFGKVCRKIEYRKPLEVIEEDYRDVIRHLRKGTTIRDTAKLTGHCVRTVQRIKNEFGIKKLETHQCLSIKNKP